MPGLRSRVVPVIAAGLLVAATVSVLAEDAVAPPAEFSGIVPCNFTAEDPGQVTETVVGTVEGGDLILRQTRGQVWRLADAQSADQRFSGTYVRRFDLDAYYGPGQNADEAPTLLNGTYRIESVDGAWQGSFSSGTWPGRPTSDGWSGAITLHGEGAFDGMTALWTERYSDELCEWEFKGVVFDGQPPSTAE